nr:capsid protein [Sarcosphaera coronaria partitivirus]
MSSQQAKLNAKAAKIGSKATEIVFTEQKLPDPSTDFTTQFKAASSASKDISNEFILNVLPDFTPILMIVMFHCTRTVPALEASRHAKISVSTYIAYCMSLIYGYFLAADIYIRPSSTAQAQSYEETSYKAEFLEFLLSLPVPEFLVPILSSFAPTCDETRPNVQFIPSAAGFTYFTHFGTFYPINMFTHIHDLVAEIPANTPRNQVLQQFLRLELYTITAQIPRQANFTARLGNLICAGFPASTTAAAAPQTYGSRLFQHFSAVFNPVIFRDYQRRSTLASISLRNKTYPTPHMSFYDLIFSSDRANLSELTIVFRSISSAMQGNIKCSSSLAGMFKDQSGTNIMTHAYSVRPLPWYFHSALATDITANAPLTSNLTTVEPSAFAISVSFLPTFTGTAATNLTQPTMRPAPTAPANVAVTFDSVFNRLHPAAPTTAVNVPDFNDDFVTYTDEARLFPRALVLNPSDPSTIDAWKATAYGMVIYTADLDGTVLPVPNVDINLGIENSWFADSAVAYRYVIWNTSTFVGTAVPAVERKRRLPDRQTRFPAASLLIDRTTVNLPRAQPTVFPATNSNQYFAGLTFVLNANFLQYLQSFMGFRTADRRSPTAAADEVLGMPDARLNVWSPYSYVAIDNDNLPTTMANMDRIYFITNLRTLFGTRIPLVRVNNAMECMPLC